MFSCTTACFFRSKTFSPYIQTTKKFVRKSKGEMLKAQIVRAGFTMQELVDRLADEYDWSDSVSNLSAKLQRESIRYKEVVELANVLGYDIVWQKRRDNR